MKPIESYIAQHFTAIYDEVRYGVKGQKREYFESLERVDGTPFPVSIPHWYLSAKEEDLIDCIAETLHLCLNAGKIDIKFQELEDWTWDLLKIACSGVSHNIINVKTLRVLINSSEQFTSFIFRQLNWDYDARTDFEGRIRFLREKLMAQNDRTSFCCNLLTAMRAQRNVGSHLAMFYLHRAETLQRLVYQLYDIITVVFIIRHVLGVDFKSKDWKIIGAPDNMKDVSIKVECDDTEGQVKGFKLYQSRGDKDDGALMPTLTDNTGATYNVKRFGTYRIALVMADGNETEKSERFKVDHGYFSGCEVMVTIPPKQVGKPKVEISTLLLYNEDDLPQDLTFVLHQMNKYQGENGQDFIPIAKSLLMASATGTKHDKQVFESKVTEMKNGMLELAPERMMDYLKAYSGTIHDALTIDYENQPSAIKLLETIDKVYDKLFALMRSDPDQEGRPIIDQLDERVNQFLAGDIQSFGTTATEKQKEISQELLHLKTLIKLGEKYPEIIEAEFGPHWLLLQADDMYVDSVNQYITKELIEFNQSTDALVEYTKQHVVEDVEENNKNLSWVCCNMIERILPHTAEYEVALCVFGRDLLCHWLYGIKLPEEDGDFKKLKNDWLKKLNNLCSRHPKNSLYTISLEEKDLQQAEEKLQEMRILVNELQALPQQLFNALDEVTQQQKEAQYQYDSFKDWINKRVFKLMWEPPVIKYVNEYKEEFDSFCFLINQYDVLDLLNILWADDYDRIHIWGTHFGSDSSMSCLSLGISHHGLGDPWINCWDNWEEKVAPKVDRLMDLFSEMKTLSQKRGQDRKCELSKLNPSDADVLKDKVKIILASQIETIKRNYGDNLPVYITDIIKASDSDIPAFVKIRMLRWLILIHPSNVIRDLIILVWESLRSINGISSKAWTFRKFCFVTGEYAKLIFNDEFVEKIVPVLQPEFKKMYLESLLNIRCGGWKGKYYCQAMSLNETYQLIPSHDLFEYMASFRHHGGIDFKYTDELDWTCKILEFTQHYCNQYPDDNEIRVLHEKQVEDFRELCVSYVNEHVKIQEPQKESFLQRRRDLTLKDKIKIEQDDNVRVKLLYELESKGTIEEMRHIISILYVYLIRKIRVPTESDLMPTLDALRYFFNTYGNDIKPVINEKNTDFIDVLVFCYNYIHQKN